MMTRCGVERLMAVVLCLASAAWTAALRADPCGMVPPIYVGDDVPITRVGLQKTYVFYRDGVESFVIRPGFSGKVEDFGMLIPFPEPPAIRKVADNIFAQVEAAIDPPEVVVNLYPAVPMAAGFGGGAGALANSAERGLGVNEVRVLRQEAVGMYEVAVLEAGSAAALKRWMDDHGYVYPTGMDKVCDEYVALRWCFVAVKTRVGPKAAVDPQPGMRDVRPGLPAGATFDGHVQAMGFRFRTPQLVVPMRLSAFNAGELRNVVYILTDGPRRIRSIPEEYVVRQVSGEQLLRNVTQPLPLRVIGGTEKDIPEWRLKTLAEERDPAPHNGLAKDLFASDLLAVRQGRLSNPHEEAEKMLLRIGEAMQLRGPEIDELNQTALKGARDEALRVALDDLKQTTMTVIDGDFPREVLGAQNLQFAEYVMPGRRNSPQVYDAKEHGPRGEQPEMFRGGPARAPFGQRPASGSPPRWFVGLGITAGGFVLCGLALWGRRRR
jgi:hypothetical protein